MMSNDLNILFLGATGYIGGSVLVSLLNHPKALSFNITTIVRNVENAEKLKRNFGINDVIIGSLSEDLDLLENAAADSDIVFSLADSDESKSIKAILNGLRKRYEISNKAPAPVLIHASGTGCLMDDANGKDIPGKIYSDASVDDMESIPDTQYHRNVDSEILKADREGYIKSYIVLPGYVFGDVSNKLMEEGIQHTFNRLLPMYINITLGRGEAGYIGEGTNVFGFVDNDELVDLFILLFDSILDHPETTGHGREGSYFAVNGEFNWLDMTQALAEGLFNAGKLPKPATSRFTEEELDKYFQGAHLRRAVSGNSRASPDRSKALGWKPVKAKEEFLESVRSTVERLAAAA